jgi:hypothetical protein
LTSRPALRLAVFKDLESNSLPRSIPAQDCQTPALVSN